MHVDSRSSCAHIAAGASPCSLGSSRPFVGRRVARRPRSSEARTVDRDPKPGIVQGRVATSRMTHVDPDAMEPLECHVGRADRALEYPIWICPLPAQRRGALKCRRDLFQVSPASWPHAAAWWCGLTSWQSPAKRANAKSRCTTMVGPLWQVHCRVRWPSSMGQCLFPLDERLPPRFHLVEELLEFPCAPQALEEDCALGEVRPVEVAHVDRPL